MMDAEPRPAAENRRLRILYCEGNTDGTVGGSYYSLLFLVSGIDKSRYEPIVVFHKYNDLIPRFQEAGIDIRVIEKPAPFSFTLPSDESLTGYRFFYPVLRLIQKAVNFLRFLPLAGAKYARYLKTNEIDLVHLNNSIIRNHDWMLGALLSSTKCVTHERGINENYPRLSRYFARRLDAVICISSAVRNSLQEKGVTTRTAVTIYNGIDPDTLVIKESAQQIRDRYDVGSDVALIGVIGNIKQWKGQETIIKAMPGVLEKYPATTCLLIGDVSPHDASYEKHLWQLISRLDLQGKVIFTGYTANVADHIGALDVVLHTSIDPEPFGRVLIEAMSLKKPLIGAAAGAVPEIIEHGETGLTFTPGDSHSLTSCIVRMLDNPERAKEMGRLGYIRLLENFHIDRNLMKTEELYESLLSHY